MLVDFLTIDGNKVSIRPENVIDFFSNKEDGITIINFIQFDKKFSIRVYDTHTEVKKKLTGEG